MLKIPPPRTLFHLLNPAFCLPFLPISPILCFFFFLPWASLCPFSAWMMNGFTSHVFFIQFLSCWLYFAFFLVTGFELHVWLQLCSLWLQPLVSVSGVVFLASLPPHLTQWPWQHYSQSTKSYLVANENRRMIRSPEKSTVLFIVVASHRHRACS